MEWAPVAIAFGAVVGAIMTWSINRARITADHRREFDRWSAEKRLGLYTEALQTQRQMMFVTHGILKLGVTGSTLAASRDPDRYTYLAWRNLSDGARATATSLRLLGGDIVADHLDQILDTFWDDDVRTYLRGSIEPDADILDCWEREGGRAEWYWDELHKLAAEARADIDAIVQGRVQSVGMTPRV